MCHAHLPFHAVLELQGIAGSYKGKVIPWREPFPTKAQAENFVAKVPVGHKGRVGFAGKFKVLSSKVEEIA